MADFKTNYNLEEWYEYIRDRVFLVRLYRRTGDWTPYEIEAKDPKQSLFEAGDQSFHYCRIENFVELPDGDVLLGIRYLHPETLEEDTFVDYRKLTDVSLIMPDEVDTGKKKEEELQTKED